MKIFFWVLFNEYYEKLQKKIVKKRFFFLPLLKIAALKIEFELIEKFKWANYNFNQLRLEIWLFTNFEYIFKLSET